MVKRVVRAWILNEDVYRITIALYSDNTYTYNAFTNLRGEHNVQGEGWHEDMLKTDYVIKDGNRIGIIKLKTGEEIVIGKRVKTYDAYPKTTPNQDKYSCNIS
jgi:hypothetical protein